MDLFKPLDPVFLRTLNKDLSKQLKADKHKKHDLVSLNLDNSCYFTLSSTLVYSWVAFCTGCLWVYSQYIKSLCVQTTASPTQS